MEKEITLFIRTYLEEISPLKLSSEEEFLNYYFINNVHIDSFGIIRFIVSLEDAFNIVFEPEDTESDEFRYVEGLVKIIQRKVLK